MVMSWKINRQEHREIRFLQNNGGTPSDGAPSAFIFQEFGIKSLELELVCIKIICFPCYCNLEEGCV